MTRRAALMVSAKRIEYAIVFLRGEKALLDSDLAELYGVTTKALNQAVKRNRARFPADFMFRLTAAETAQVNRPQSVTGSREVLRSQTVTSKGGGRGGRRYLPFAFTEQGVAMLSSVLHSERAVLVNIEIMRAFVRLRQILAVNAELARRLDDLEKRIGAHDDQFLQVVQAIRQLMEPPPPANKGCFGFHMPEKPKATEEKPGA